MSLQSLIKPLQLLVPQADLAKVLATGRTIHCNDGKELVGMYENMKKVYFVVAGRVGVWIEDRLSSLIERAEDGQVEGVHPSDLILSPEILTGVEFGEGDFVLYEHSLYEQFVPYRVTCLTECTLIEIEGNLFKAHIHGRRMLPRKGS